MDASANSGDSDFPGDMTRPAALRNTLFLAHLEVFSNKSMPRAGGFKVAAFIHGQFVEQFLNHGYLPEPGKS
ncbi:hypothetical protein UB46_25605 [Burkholderiaceae bacterium 16]|nr:hypothetical protein UB46_25605 [Burkholderiaceae bacterium 16]